MNYLQEHGLQAYPDVEAACDAAVQTYHSLFGRTKANSMRMKEIAELQRHIGTYHKTREIYTQYRKLPPKKQEEFSPNTPAPGGAFFSSPHCPRAIGVPGRA